VVTTTELSEALEEAGYRLTAQRRAVADLIASHDGHFTANDLIADSRRRRLGVGRATIFRSVEVLTELGLIERLDLPDGGHALVACRSEHHHHLVCSSCGRSTEVAATGLSSILRDVATRSGYRISSHRLEVFGLCPACQAPVSRPAPR
jgi:Fur family ferric uptake transcriptional regulator